MPFIFQTRKQHLEMWGDLPDAKRRGGGSRAKIRTRTLDPWKPLPPIICTRFRSQSRMGARKSLGGRRALGAGPNLQKEMEG